MKQLLANKCFKTRETHENVNAKKRKERKKGIAKKEEATITWLFSRTWQVLYIIYRISKDTFISKLPLIK